MPLFVHVFVSLCVGSNIIEYNVVGLVGDNQTSFNTIIIQHSSESALTRLTCQIQQSLSGVEWFGCGLTNDPDPLLS